MRKTKIICTIGPACNNYETLKKMCLAGMNVARLNFSHGTYEDHKKNIDLLKQVRDDLNLPVAILLDTKGPEYRIGSFKDKKVTLKDGDTFTFTTEKIIGDNTGVSVNYDKLIDELDVGDTITVNNGLLVFEVVSVEGDKAVCRVVNGGEISDRKSMSFPGKVLNKEYLSEQDKADILFGIENDVDFIAASFVSREQDVRDIRNFLHENGGDNIDIIAKIENAAGVDNIYDICKACEGIMVARGDLGVEVPFTQLPAIQKKLITTCRLLGHRVITATEMLESMINNPRPTRAEISDVANAVYDGTSAVMLSGETAAGKYPAKTVATMAEIVEETEKNIDYKKWFYETEFKIKNTLDAISHSACGVAMDIGAKCIVVCTLSGQTARMVSRFRSPIDIIGMTTSKKVWYKLAMSWGVTPVISKPFSSTDVLFYHALESAQSTFELKTGDKMVVTGGQTSGASGNTNLIKIETII